MKVFEKIGDVTKKIADNQVKGVEDIFNGEAIKTVWDLVTPPPIELSEEELNHFGGDDIIERESKFE